MSSDQHVVSFEAFRFNRQLYALLLWASGEMMSLQLPNTFETISENEVSLIKKQCLSYGCNAIKMVRYGYRMIHSKIK